MDNNFECRYINFPGTYCFDKEEMITPEECNDCEINNNCEYCVWKLTNPELCEKCKFKEEVKC